jgi:hypothetical protein
MWRYMKKLHLISVSLFFICFLVFGEAEEQEEIDYLLFLPNSGNMFVNEAQAMVQLDNIAKYLAGRDIASGQINVYGYTAAAVNDIDSVSLSRDRALFVINELQRRGVPRNLFSEPVGHGEVDLWGGNTSEESRSPNRRVRVVLDGNVIIVEPSTGQVRGSEPPPLPVLEKENDETPIREYTAVSRKEFPWWILLLILIFLFVPFVFSKNRKRPVYKKTKPKRVEPPPAPVPASESIEPPAVPVKASGNIEPPAVPVKASGNIEPPAVPVKASGNIEPPAVSVKASESVVPVITTASEKVAPLAVPEAGSKKAVPSTVETRESIVCLEEEIRHRAHEHYLLRNGENGSMDGDWYKALPEICAKYEADGYQVYSDGSWWARKSFSRNI